MLRTYWRFLIVLTALSVSLLLLDRTKVLTPKESYPQMIEAARKTEAAFLAVKEERLSRGYPISAAEDLNQTGLIGDSYTEITTTLGSLEAKRSSVNPNTAAMIVDMLTECGVGEGDVVAVNLSSSFPALNLAVVCALDTVGADGILINSVGASTYGANLPGFTYLDMEQALLERGLIKNHCRFFSLGGSGDMGREMPAEVRDTIVERLTGYGLSFLSFEDTEENLSARMNLYEANGQPTCFINVGGNLLAFNGTGMISAQSGLLLPSSRDSRSSGTGDGLIPRFLDQGIPVIHLLNMKDLLPANGLPYDPSPMPAVGDGDVYLDWQYNRPLAVVSLLASLALFVWAVRRFPHKKIPL